MPGSPRPTGDPTRHPAFPEIPDPLSKRVFLAQNGSVRWTFIFWPIVDTPRRGAAYQLTVCTRPRTRPAHVRAGPWFVLVDGESGAIRRCRRGCKVARRIIETHRAAARAPARSASCMRPGGPRRQNRACRSRAPARCRLRLFVANVAPSHEDRVTGPGPAGSSPAARPR